MHRADNYGSPDPWASRFVLAGESIPLVTEHSAGQNRLAPSAAQPRPVVAVPQAGGFDWAYAAIGAGGALALLLLAAGTVFNVRRARGRMAPVGS